MFISSRSSKIRRFSFSTAASTKAPCYHPVFSMIAIFVCSSTLWYNLSKAMLELMAREKGAKACTGTMWRYKTAGLSYSHQLLCCRCFPLRPRQTHWFIAITYIRCTNAIMSSAGPVRWYSRYTSCSAERPTLTYVMSCGIAPTSSTWPFCLPQVRSNRSLLQCFLLVTSHTPNTGRGDSRVVAR